MVTSGSQPSGSFGRLTDSKSSRKNDARIDSLLRIVRPMDDAVELGRQLVRQIERRAAIDADGAVNLNHLAAAGFDPQV
jgi:hypothetical protein